MDRGVLVRIDEVAEIARGGGVATRPLVTSASSPGARISTGLTIFPPGEGARMHSHDCDEQVTILAGSGVVEIDGEAAEMGLHDTTYIPAGLPHRFENTGAAPLTILWIYAAPEVTRTFADTGETVVHLSGADRLAG